MHAQDLSEQDLKSYEEVAAIRTSDGRLFPGRLWRKALVHYLSGIWADNQEFGSEPKLMFLDGRNQVVATLRLGRVLGFGIEPGPRPNRGWSHDTLPNDIVTDDKRLSVMDGLMRFSLSKMAFGLSIADSDMCRTFRLRKVRGKRGGLLVDCR